jgi:hypothetical protein
MQASNPYEPTDSAPDLGLPRSRRLRSFVVLNLLLLGIPFAIAILTAVELFVHTYSEVVTTGGDPITVQHVYSDFVDFSFLLPLLYFGIPNLLLVTWYLVPIVLATRKKLSRPGRRSQV